jgi:hypothetical protein
VPATAPPEAVGRSRLPAVLAAGAVIMAIALPPVGLALGIATLVVMALRRTGKVGMSRPTALLTVVSGVFAVVVGGLLSVLLLLLGQEMTSLRECLAGANTRVAEQVCQDEFRDAVLRRLT